MQIKPCTCILYIYAVTRILSLSMFYAASLNITLPEYRPIFADVAHIARQIDLFLTSAEV
jgi:hypothetical protein